ncbi:MAG: hypothetical protein KKI08_23685 [Armatimonadetes bacterium]|nr:hypothetical protein [Armatimonadota bacterium]
MNPRQRQVERGWDVGAQVARACYYAVALIIVAAVVLFIVPCNPRGRPRQESCLSNMKSLALATLSYAHEWDGKLPPRPRMMVSKTLAEGVGEGVDLAQLVPPDDWRRQIHYRNNQVFVCPSTHSIYSYDFSPGVYGAECGKLTDPGKTVMEFEKGFLTGSPPGPHNGDYNVTFCDGHGKWRRSFAADGSGLTLDGRMNP